MARDRMLYAEYWRWEDADRALAEASRRDPGTPATETLRAVVQAGAGRHGGRARSLALRRGARSRRPPGAMGERLMLPQVYESVEDVARWRARYAEGLARLVARCRAGSRVPRMSSSSTATTSCSLTRERTTASCSASTRGLLARLAGAVHPEWREGRAARPSMAAGGCASASWAASSATAPRDAISSAGSRGSTHARFERFVYHTARSTDDFTRRIAAARRALRDAARRRRALAARHRRRLPRRASCTPRSG